MLELLAEAVKSLIDHGGILGALVVVFGVLIVWQYLNAAKERRQLQERIEQLQQGADPERVALRQYIADLQERRVHEATSRDASSKVAIERAANAMEQVSTAIGEQADALRDLENLVRRKRS